MRRLVALILGFSLFTLPVWARAGERPDYPTPRSTGDRITRYRMWQMHEVSAVPPYTYKLVNPAQAPVTEAACFHALRAEFTAHKPPHDDEHPQIVMLLQWLKPDYSGWIGCWPTPSASYVAWEKHTSTTRGVDETSPPYWYRVWKHNDQPTSSATCLELIKRRTGRRVVALIKWYDVSPDPPPDREKQIGCMPFGFDPEIPNPK